ncbi:MAG: hypothetical protein SVM80_05315 [Halobacteriota archaeon]|nr:hypothetical protein [Halobacteriota archaeon]
MKEDSGPKKEAISINFDTLVMVLAVFLVFLSLFAFISLSYYAIPYIGAYTNSFLGLFLIALLAQELFLFRYTLITYIFGPYKRDDDK